MHPLKHMELIFGLVVSVALLLAATAEGNARAASPGTGGAGGAGGASAGAIGQPIASAGTPAVVIIRGKRMSSREKRRAALSAAEGMHIF